jgi:hypothetical protein
MIEQDKKHDHWKELAEQLGLPPEDASSPAPEQHDSREPRSNLIAEKREVEERLEPKPAEERKHHHRTSRASEERPPADEPNFFGKDELTFGQSAFEPELSPVHEIEKDDAVTAPDQGDEPTLEISEKEEETTPTEEEENPRGRRRRGGRGGKRRPEGGRPEGKSGRTREPGTRGRPKSEPSEKKGAPVEVVDEEAGDDMEDLSDWTVPSWQDLISSLYRPDR